MGAPKARARIICPAPPGVLPGSTGRCWSRLAMSCGKPERRRCSFRPSYFSQAIVRRGCTSDMIGGTMSLLSILLGRANKDDGNTNTGYFGI
jgi:hypothetical protein